MQQAYARCIASRFADGRRIHADDFAVVADQHDLAGFVDLRDGDDFADALGGLHVDHAFAAAVGQAVFVGGRALAVAVFGDGKNQLAFDGCVNRFGFTLDLFLGGRGGVRLGRGGHADYVVFLFQVDAPDAIGGAAHGADVAFVEAHGHAFVAGEEYDLVAIGDANRDQFVAVFNVDRVDAVGAHVHELAQLRFFYQTFARREEDIFIFFLEITHRHQRLHGFAGLQADQVADVFALACGADVGNFVDVQPVDAALVGEDENVGVRRSNEKMLDKIFAARLHAGAARASAALHAVGGDGRALHIAGVADCDRDLLVGNEIFENDF